MHIILIQLSLAKILPVGLKFPILMSFDNLLCDNAKPAIISSSMSNFHQKLS